MIIDESPEFAIGLISPRVSHEDIVELILKAPREPEEIGRNIAGNRCLLVADTVLDAAKPHSVLDGARAAYQKYLGIASARRDVIDDTCRLLDRISKEAEIPIWGIKGLASRTGYSDPSQRQLSDADIAVETQEQAFRLAYLLRRHGYTTDEGELPWLKADINGVPYGQYRLLPPKKYLSVDIHFGQGYSTGHCGLLPIPMPRELGIHPLPLVDNLAPMLGNSGGDVHITTKDVNDLWVASEHLGTDDAKVLMGNAATTGFLEHLRGIAKVTLETTELDGRRREVLSHLAGPGDLSTQGLILASGNKPVKHFTRAFRTARSAFQQARSLTSSTVKSTFIAMNALAYYSASLKLRVAPVPAMSAPRPAPWRCVRLVPVELAASRGLDWGGDAVPNVDTDAEGVGDLKPVNVNGRPRLLKSGRSLFVPTVWYLLPAGTVRAATQKTEGATP